MLFMDRTESLKPSIVKQSLVYKCTERKKKQINWSKSEKNLVSWQLACTCSKSKATFIKNEICLLKLF